MRSVLSIWKRVPVVASLALAGACTPKIPTDPVPEAMAFDPTATPPRVPEPTHVIINPLTGRLDFSLAGITVPADCTNAKPMPQAQCEFYHYLQSLDGYPTVTPARAPATAALDPATLTPQNVVVVDASTRQVVPDVTIGFDGPTNDLTITPTQGWKPATLYVLGVRGYAGGVKATGGREVVASVPYFLLKQPDSLTCGATVAAAIPDSCPAYALLAQQMMPTAARATALQLEQLRMSYASLHATDLLSQVGGNQGISLDQLAVYWAFPTHSSPVAELNPATGAVPQVMGTQTIAVAVKGAIDPSTLVPTTAGKPGTVTLLDLTAVQGADLINGLPPFDVSYAGGAIVLQTHGPLVAGHQYGVFLATGITSPDHKPLVPSPVSFLLTAHGAIAVAGKSQVDGVADADAVMLEAGRAALVDLFDNLLVQSVTGLDRAKLAYVVAFPFGGP